MTVAQPVSFARGAPSLDIVDIEGLKAAAMRALDLHPAAVAGYGPVTGYPPLRDWIARRHGVDVAEVLVTNGSLQADTFLFDHLLGPGDSVVVERPTYDRTLANLKRRGVRIHQAPLDRDGLDVDALREALEGGLRPRLAHVIPNFQNPTGVTLSLPRRHELVRLARRYEFIIFEDDPYVDVRFRGERLPAMLGLDDPEDRRVVAAGSFTKTICPGVRVGYLIGAAPMISEIAQRALTTYISPNMLAEVTVHEFCANGALDRSIGVIQRALAERAAHLAQALRREILGCRFADPDGGYFLWVDLPDGVDAGALVPVAAQHGVAVVKGSDFLLEGGQGSLRLAFASVTPAEIDQGVARLAAAVAQVRAPAAQVS